MYLRYPKSSSFGVSRDDFVFEGHSFSASNGSGDAIDAVVGFAGSATTHYYKLTPEQRELRASFAIVALHLGGTWGKDIPCCVVPRAEAKGIAARLSEHYGTRGGSGVRVNVCGIRQYAYVTGFCLSKVTWYGQPAVRLFKDGGGCPHGWFTYPNASERWGTTEALDGPTHQESQNHDTWCKATTEAQRIRNEIKALQAALTEQLALAAVTAP